MDGTACSARTIANPSQWFMRFGGCSPIVSGLKRHTLEEADVLIQKTAQESEVCRRLDAIPGIGPLTATGLIAAIGNAAAFRKGREFAAEELFLGLLSRTLYCFAHFLREIIRRGRVRGLFSTHATHIDINTNLFPRTTHLETVHSSLSPLSLLLRSNSCSQYRTQSMRCGERRVECDAVSKSACARKPNSMGHGTA